MSWPMAMTLAEACSFFLRQTRHQEWRGTISGRLRLEQKISGKGKTVDGGEQHPGKHDSSCAWEKTTGLY